MRLGLPLLTFALVVLAAYAPSPVLRIPTAPARTDSTEWENLQVLPDTLTRGELVGVMRGFTRSLGVRCEHCHIRGDGGMEFASDANPHKDVARAMIRMTAQINREILPAIEGLHEAHGPRVTCYTCHRGAPRPEITPPAEEEDASPAPEPTHDHEHGEHDHGDHGHDDG